MVTSKNLVGGCFLNYGWKAQKVWGFVQRVKEGRPSTACSEYSPKFCDQKTAEARENLLTPGLQSWYPTSQDKNQRNRYIFPCPYACVHAKSLQSCLFAALWTEAHQTPLSMEFSRQEHWSGLPCPTPGDLPTQESNPHLLWLLTCRQILYCWATREALPCPQSFPNRKEGKGKD